MANKAALKRIEAIESLLSETKATIRIYSKDGTELLEEFTEHNCPLWAWYKSAPDWKLEQFEAQRKALSIKTLDDYYPTDDEMAAWEKYCANDGYQPLDLFLDEYRS